MGMNVQKEYKPLQILSFVAVLLAALATIVGTGFSAVYRDNDFVRTAWLANDWVTMAFVLPSLLLIIFAAGRGSKMALLVWPGMAAFLVYNYAFYLFAAAFNKLFLVYILLVVTSLYSLITLWKKVAAQSWHISPGARRYTMAYLLLIGLMLVLVEVPPILSFIYTGQLPPVIAQTGHPTASVYALDLTFIVPACLGAVYGLWQKRSWAVLLAAIMLVKGAAYGLVLVAGTLLLAARKVAQDPLLPFYILITTGGIAGLVAMGRVLKNEHMHTEKPPVITVG